MLDKSFDAVAVGTRIRNARNAKGWTLAELAEKAETTYQNISKFENKGLSDMNWITTLSYILETDLLEDAIDIEGSVSEIGKEILFKLVIHGGSCETHILFEQYMYGLSEAQTTKEIVKLAKIGLVVREKYIDYDEDEIDEVFITAKGIITLKNMQLNMAQSVAIEECLTKKKDEDGEEEEATTKSYEYLIGPYSSYSELIQSHKDNNIEKILRSLPVISEKDPLNPYRAFYIDYLKSSYQDGYENEYSFLNHTACFRWNAYQIIISRMIFGLDEERIKVFLSKEIEKKRHNALYAKYEDAINPLLDEEDLYLDAEFEEWAYHGVFFDGDEELENRYNSLLGDTFTSCIAPEFIDNIRKYAIKYSFEYDDLGEVFNINYDSIYSSLETQEEKDYFELLKEVWDKLGPESKAESEELDDIYDYNKFYDVLEEHKTSYVSEIYTDEEIRQFIENTFRPASNELEKEIDNKLKEMAKIKPDVLDYFTFPKRWEENGLADLVRRNSGLF